MGCVILCVQKVLLSRVLLLEGQDGQAWKDHVHNCVMYHLFYLNGQIAPSWVVVSIGCVICRVGNVMDNKL
jgi:hypothetical protein